MLVHNTVLEELSVEYNRFTEEGETILHSTAAVSKSLKRLNMYGWINLEEARSSNSDIQNNETIERKVLASI